MGDSGVARVEYRLSAPTPPLCFLRNWQSGVLEKNVFAKYEWTAFGREGTPRSGCRRNRFSARGSFAKMRQKFDAPARCSTEQHALEMRDAGGALSEKSEALA